MEDDLKALVAQTLEAKGVLGKVRAQVRASVFTAVSEEDRRTGVYLESTTTAKIHQSKESLFLANLIREYLEFYELDFTASVFEPEANLDNEAPHREGLISKLQEVKAGSPFTPNNSLPLLHHLYLHWMEGGKPAPGGLRRPGSAPAREKRNITFAEHDESFQEPSPVPSPEKPDFPVQSLSTAPSLGNDGQPPRFGGLPSLGGLDAPPLGGLQPIGGSSKAREESGDDSFTKYLGGGSVGATDTLDDSFEDKRPDPDTEAHNSISSGVGGWDEPEEVDEIVEEVDEVEEVKDASNSKENSHEDHPSVPVRDLTSRPPQKLGSLGSGLSPLGGGGFGSGGSTSGLGGGFSGLGGGLGSFGGSLGGGLGGGSLGGPLSGGLGRGFGSGLAPIGRAAQLGGDPLGGPVKDPETNSPTDVEVLPFNDDVDDDDEDEDIKKLKAIEAQLAGKPTLASTAGDPLTESFDERSADRSARFEDDFDSASPSKSKSRSRSSSPNRNPSTSFSSRKSSKSKSRSTSKSRSRSRSRSKSRSRSASRTNSRSKSRSRSNSRSKSRSQSHSRSRSRSRSRSKSPPKPSRSRSKSPSSLIEEIPDASVATSDCSASSLHAEDYDVLEIAELP